MKWIQETFQYNLLGLYYLSAAILCSVLGLIVLLYKPKSKLNQSFFLITLTCFLWQFSFFMVLSLTSHTQSLFWAYLNYTFSVPYIAPSVYFFTVVWSKEKKPKIKPMLGFIVGIIFSLWNAFYFDDIFVLQLTQWGKFNKLITTNLMGPLFFSSLLIFFFSFTYLSLKQIFITYKSSVAPEEKRQYLNFTIGFSIAVLGANDFLVCIGLNQWVTGHISMLIFLSIIAYTMIRYQFLQINLVNRKIILLLLIYIGLFAITIPLFIPKLISVFHFGASKRNIIEFGLSMLISGLLLSVGPFIYAFLTKEEFWLKGQLAAGFTHEIKSPLSSIDGALEVLSTEIKKPALNQERLREYVEMIKSNSLRLEELTINLLNIAQIQEGSFQLIKTNINLSEVTRSIINLLLPAVEKKGLKFQLSLDSSLFIPADEVRLKQIISNILTNAIKFSNSGDISVSFKKIQNSVIFSVSDQGRGIQSDDLKKIFNRFYQGKHQAKGSGLGLAIAKAWVEAHEGKIWAESEGIGKGTKISFTLPV
ncbi:MAG: ATP-binding protein [Elusimicrobiota bacterium]